MFEKDDENNTPEDAIAVLNQAKEEVEKVLKDHQSAGGALVDSPFDNLPGFTKPSTTAIIDNAELIEILIKEGFNVNDEQIQALNFFNSPIGAFQYALYYFGLPDFYIVLMVNKRHSSVYGYHIIDFTDKYSLSDDLSNRMKTPSMVL